MTELSLKIFLLTLADMNIKDKEVYKEISEQYNLLKLFNELKSEDDYVDSH